MERLVLGDARRTATKAVRAAARGEGHGMEWLVLCDARRNHLVGDAAARLELQLAARLATQCNVMYCTVMLYMIQQL